MPGYPPIEIQRSRWMNLAYLALAPGMPVALLLWMLADGSSAGDIGAVFGYLLFVAVLAGGANALVLHRLHRTRRRLLANAPPGTVYVGPCWRVVIGSADSPRGARGPLLWTAGLFVIDDSGIAFTRSRSSQSFPEVRLTWSDIDGVTWKRITPFKGVLNVTTVNRLLHGWELPVAVEKALRQVQQRSGVDG